MVEGGHMVIARSLAQALRDAGHIADIVVTPQNRFGRQASAYVATWFTDVESSDGSKIDQDQYALSTRDRVRLVKHCGEPLACAGVVTSPRKDITDCDVELRVTRVAK